MAGRRGQRIVARARAFYKRVLVAKAPKIEHPKPALRPVPKHVLRKQRQAAQRAAEAAKRGAR